MPDQATRQIRESIDQCIKDCLDCYSACLETVAYCLQMGVRHAEARHIQLLLDCAEVCRTSTNFMLRGSEMHRRICDVCADVCERCAASCRRLGDEKMMACAEVCNRCAESCRRMAKATATE